MIWDGREVGSQQSIAVIMRVPWKHARMRQRPLFHFKCNSIHWLAIFYRARAHHSTLRFSLSCVYYYLAYVAYVHEHSVFVCCVEHFHLCKCKHLLTTPLVLHLLGSTKSLNHLTTQTTKWIRTLFMRHAYSLLKCQTQRIA